VNQPGAADLAARWIRMVRLISSVERDVNRELYSEHRILLSELGVARAIADGVDGRATMSELCAVTGMSASGVTRAVERLVADGLLVRRRANTGDRRLRYVQLSSDGYRRVDAARQTYSAALSRQLSAEITAQLRHVGEELDQTNHLSG
jgi:DNA-binding MarR family transcriptional regulator